MTKRNDRPVFSRLPVRGYQDNPVADALTQFYDSKLVDVGRQIEQLHTKLNPNTAPVVYLDWLAYLVGMVEPYYSPNWSEAVKRKAIANAQAIFSNRGTMRGLDLALSIHGFRYSFFASDDLKLTFTFDANTKFGKSAQTVYVLLPLEYARNSYEYREAQRAIKNYTAIVAPVKPCYDKFYIDFSTIGDPLFS